MSILSDPFLGSPETCKVEELLVAIVNEEGKTSALKLGFTVKLLKWLEVLNSAGLVGQRMDMTGRQNLGVKLTLTNLSYDVKYFVLV